MLNISLVSGDHLTIIAVNFALSPPAASSLAVDSVLLPLAAGSGLSLHPASTLADIARARANVRIRVIVFFILFVPFLVLIFID